MEASTRAMDGARWRDAVDPAVEDRLAAAIDELAQLPLLDATVMRVLATVDDPDSTSLTKRRDGAGTSASPSR